MKKNKDGYYKTKIVLGHDRDTGKPISKWIMARTVREIEAKKEYIRKAYITGTLEAPGDVMATDAIKDYLKAKANKVAPQSMAPTMTVYRRYIEPALRGKRLCAVRRSDLQDILNDMEGMSVSYHRIAVSIFKATCAMAYSDGVIQVDPATHLTKPRACKPKIKRALTPDERIRIESIAETNVPLALLYYTGMRIGEMRALSWSDIDLTNDVIHVTKTCLRSAKQYSEGKTAAAKRDIPIVAPLHAILQANRALPSVRILAISSQRAELRFRELFDFAGMPDVTPHHLRHNFVTLCWERHMDVMITSRIVGHSSPAITMGIYTHLSKQHGDDIREQVDRLFTKAK